MLRRFCIIQSIRIGNVIYEDHSGNSFRRTEWTKLVSDLRGHKRHADFILFTTWDRFSTHTESAFRMYSMLLELDIQAQAIEQPLNLSVPCNKQMLAFYLSASRIENQRSEFDCIGRAKRKSGQITNTFPNWRNKRIQSKRKEFFKEKRIRHVLSQEPVICPNCGLVHIVHFLI